MTDHMQQRNWQKIEWVKETITRMRQKHREEKFSQPTKQRTSLSGMANWNGNVDIHFFKVHYEELKDERYDVAPHLTQWPKNPQP